MGDIYPPGSTFKMVTGLSALTAGTATRNTVVNISSTVLTVSGFNFYDWRQHGPLNFVDGYAHSSDIYFYTLAGGSPMGPGSGGSSRPADAERRNFVSHPSHRASRQAAQAHIAPPASWTVLPAQRMLAARPTRRTSEAYTPGRSAWMASRTSR